VVLPLFLPACSVGAIRSGCLAVKSACVAQRARNQRLVPVIGSYEASGIKSEQISIKPGVGSLFLLCYAEQNDLKRSLHQLAALYVWMWMPLVSGEQS